MKLQKLLSYTRKAVDQYHMIQTGDKIAIGVSGGKDSLTLLYALSGLRRFYPNTFDIEAITVDLGFDNFKLDPIYQLCEKLNVNYSVVQTDIAQIIFDIRKEKSPCSLCSKMRKGALNDKAEQLGCNKIALGHHQEDIIETMMLSLFYEGRFHTFAPVTYLDRMKLYSIRPLLYCKEKDILTFSKQYDLPIVANPCPVDNTTKREAMKKLITALNEDMPGVKDRMFRAIENSTIKGWQRNI